jgi:hypothetical protein
MNKPPSPKPGETGSGWRMDETVARLEWELRQAITYMNDAVIPQVRAESISAMRRVADTLQSLADRIEKHQGGPSRR